MKNLILAQGQETFKNELTQREPDEDILPWKERAVENARELLVMSGLV